MAQYHTRTGGFACGAGMRRQRWRQTGSLMDAFDRLERTMHRPFGKHRPPFGRHGWCRSRSGGRTGLKTDKANGKILGVCAGIARSLGISRTTARVLFLVAAIPMGMGWFLLPLYVILGFVLDDYGDDTAPQATHAPGAGPAPAAESAAPHTVHPDLRFADLRRRFEDLERRTGSMEREVTSGDFDLKRAFRDLDRKDSPKA
ncbi:PspC domain-containing protein [Novispirillum itersonii]|uniref:Phage shock protein C n=1 Tax=Novispirillum itersonii TaxID=189 RepID=A0A7W9ZKC5_NOVIT|nr:PspC domain-containing protein [Novispirillum itersonii]MBB6211794.1 phage shock protein C [Novispirillum itersonii]